MFAIRGAGAEALRSLLVINILLVSFMIVGRIVLVFGWYYMNICRVSALFACNKKSGRRGAALIDFVIFCMIFIVLCWYWDGII